MRAVPRFKVPRFPLAGWRDQETHQRTQHSATPNLFRPTVLCILHHGRCPVACVPASSKDQQRHLSLLVLFCCPISIPDAIPLALLRPAAGLLASHPVDDNASLPTKCPCRSDSQFLPGRWLADDGAKSLVEKVFSLFHAARRCRIGHGADLVIGG